MSTVEEFFIKSGDLLPFLDATLTDANGDPVDLTGATVVFHMGPRRADPATVTGAATILSAVEGTVRYAWQAGDTDEVGTFRAEFEVAIAGKPLTFPNDKNFHVIIFPAVA